MDGNNRNKERSVSHRNCDIEPDEVTPLLKTFPPGNVRSLECSINDSHGLGSGSYTGDEQSSSLEHSETPQYQMGTPNLLSQKYESLDYDTCENTLFIEEQIRGPSKFSRAIAHGCQNICGFGDSMTVTSVLRWFVMLLIGFFTAITACVITISIEELSKLKFSFLKKYIDECSGYNCMLTPFAFWLLFSIVPVALGSFLVSFFAPVAAGSGIPVIKCYLNGVKVPEVVRIKTLLIKAIGVVTSVTGGLAVGKEGPMIHCGAVIGAGISQGKSTTFRKDCKIFEKFREDHEKRDFVSAGAAAGVAAAFGAPVGGVLFSLEEGASFWNQGLTMRIFFCSMISFFTLNCVLSAYHNHAGQLSYPGLLNFGKFDNLSYDILELPLYMLMGVIGGLFGALYNHVNHKLTVFRIRYVKRPIVKVMEALIVCMIGVTIAFLTTCFSSDCQYWGNDPNNYPVQVNCDDGQYKAFGTIWLQNPEASLRSLLHDAEGTWAPSTLAIFFVCYYVLGCWTYGLSISSGLFIPTLLIGAAWGRLFGIGVSALLDTMNIEHSSLCSAKFAIVGAAAMLGGVVRMTISLTVILMEAIGNITFGLPLMFSLFIAKWVGDFFNEGLYDIHIQLASVPILPWDPPPYSYNKYASELMSAPVVCFKSTEKVGKIVDVLTQESHNGFPVVDLVEDSFDGVQTFGRFRGLILRWQLIVLLQYKVFNETAERSWPSCKLTLKDFRDAYPRHPPVQQIHISPQEKNFTIDLRPFLNPSAYTISHTASLPRIFRLFRALGLRHLPVVDDKNSVVGIVTRKDIARFRARKHYGKFDVEELQVSLS